MAEPARISQPRPGGRPSTSDEPPVERTVEELMAIRMQDLSGLTRAELLALTDRDLPTLSDLLPLRMQDLPRVTRAELLALTDRDLPSINDLPPPDLMEQEEVLIYTVSALKRVLGRHPGTYVAGYTLLYDTIRPDEPGRVPPPWLEPDVLVAFGVGSHRRRSYAIWQEGKPPEFVMEIASVSTWRRDRDEKPAIYESLGVREYFLYDPVGGRLEPRLQGHVLRDGRYRPLRPERLANGERGLRSETLGLWAYLAGPEQALRWHDPVTGKALEDYAEVHAAREAAEARAAEEAAAREMAEARAAEEAAAREMAEARIAEEATAREMAEARIAEEATAREMAEARIAEEATARKAAEEELARLPSLNFHAEEFG